MKTKIVYVTLFLLISLFAPALSFAATPVIFFSDMTDGPTSGWEGSSTIGAAVSIWGLNLGSSRGSATVNVCGVTLNNDADFAEWGATTNPQTARGLQRITFWLKSNMTTGAGTISVTTSNGTSQSLPFYCSPLGTNKIYFVSPSGSDTNAGTTTASPWASFTKVRLTLATGDIAYFRNGVWTADDGNGAVVRFSAGNHQNGIANKSIAVASYPGEVAQLGDTVGSMTSIRHSQYGGTGGPDVFNYWTFSKFSIRRDTYWPNNGDLSSDDHLRFIGNEISLLPDAGSDGVEFCGYQTYFSFYGNYSHDAGGSNPPGRMYGLYLGGYGVSHDIDIGWNEFSSNANGRGMQIYGHLVGDSLDQVFVHDNYFHDNGLTGAILGGGDGGSNYEFIKNLYFYNNIVANNGIRPGEPHDGIRLDGGLSWGGWGGNFRIYNNTFYNNTEGEVEWYLPSGATPIRASFMNNIFITASQYNTNSCNSTVCSGSNNAYYGMGNGPSWVTASLNANPLLVNPAAGDFHLNTTSPAKDAGSSSVAAVVTKDYDGNTRPMGAGYDIGAYEYNGPAVPMLQFSSATYSVSEGAGTATINVTRIGSSVGAVAVNYATSNGTAVSGSDYTAASGTLNWPDGDVATKSFTVSITDDTVVESNETVNITLTSPTNGALLGSPSSVVLTITDNDSTGGGGSGSGGDSGGGSGGGGGCGYIKNDDGKGQKTKGEGLSFMLMLIIALAGIALRRIIAELKMRRAFFALIKGLSFFVVAVLLAQIAACGSGGGGDSSNSSNSSIGGSGGGTNACSGFYASGFTLMSGMLNDPYPTLAKPAKGVAFADPTYHTCVVRAADHNADGTNTFARNDYSRRQAFNADNSKYLIYDANGSWYIYNASTYALIRELTQLGGDAEPQWHPTNPDLIYWLPTNGGMVVNELNVSTNVNRVVGNFTGRLPWAGAAHVWTKSEGSPSVDGRYWAFMVENSGFNELGFIVWDLTTDTIVSTYTTSKRPDHLSMSPTGNYIVVSWDDGVMVFNRDFTNPRLVHPRGEHSDIALDANGDDVYVSIDYEAADGAVYMRNLRTGVRTDLFPSYLNGSATAFHFSGKAFNKPGWALISTYGESGSKQWLHRKVFAVQLRANPTIYNLTHTHEVYQYISSFYFAEVHASVNHDFTKIVFNSNWDVNSGSDVDAYMVEIPAGALN